MAREDFAGLRYLVELDEVGHAVLMTTEIRKRESLYGEFISECAKLLIGAMEHTLDTPSKH